MAGPVVVIYDSILFERGRDVRRWAEAVERRFTNNARMKAPSRSGGLRAGIHGRVDREGPKYLTATITSEAEHTMYVLRGTTGPIMSDGAWNGEVNEKGKPPPMRFSNPNPPRSFQVVVSGQEAQNFFDDAAKATARRHSSLRGFSPTVL